MSEHVTLAAVTERRDQWIATTKKLQERAQELSRELSQIQEQSAQLVGAIQACDLFLKETQSNETEGAVSTGDSTP